MATTDLNDYLKPWTQNTADEQRFREEFIKKGITEYNMRKSDFFSLVSQGEPANDNVVRWAYEYNYDYPVTATLSGSGTTLTLSGTVLGGQAISANLAQQLYQIGTVFMRPSDRTQVCVSAVDYSTYSATVAEHGNSAAGSISDDTAATDWVVVSDTDTDDNETHYPRHIAPSWQSCGTQIFTQEYKYLHTWSNIDMNKNLQVADRVKRDVNKLIKLMRDQLARSCLLMLPYYSSGYKYGDAAERTMMTGLYGWAVISNATWSDTELFKDMSGNAVTVNALDKIIMRGDTILKCDYGDGNWVIVCDPVTRHFISQFNRSTTRIERKETTAGQYVDMFCTSNGEKFPIVRDRHMLPGTLAIVNTSDLEWGYMQGDDVWEIDLPQSSRKHARLYTMQCYGLVHRRWDQVLYMYGMPTSA